MTVRPCDRTSCRTDTGHRDEPYCSPECRQVAEAIKQLPLMQSGAAVMGHGAAVKHAFDWLDARQTEDA